MDFSENLPFVLKNALIGDEQSWSVLFECLWPVVAGVVASRLGGTGGYALVEDVAQNVFVRLTENDAERLRKFDPDKGVLERYVARIAAHCASDFRRANAKHMRSVDIASVPEVEDHPPDSLLPAIEEWEILAALNSLSPREKQTINLLYKENRTPSEAAAIMAVTPDTIRSLKSHALKKLRKFFDQ